MIYQMHMEDNFGKNREFYAQVEIDEGMSEADKINKQHKFIRETMEKFKLKEGKRWVLLSGEAEGFVYDRS